MIIPSFVLCSAPRCGSTTLNRALNLIPGTWVSFEPMFDDIEHTPAAVSQRVREILQDNNGFKHVYRATGYPFRPVHHATIEEMEANLELWIALNTAILNYPGLRISFLGRRNGFDRIASDLVARATDQWGFFGNEVNIKEAEQYRETISGFSLPPLDERLVEWYLNNWPVMEQRLKSAVRTNPIQEIWYEDFFGEDVPLEQRIERFRELVAFLGIRAPADFYRSDELRVLLSPSSKLNDAPTFARIPNYQALRARYAEARVPTEGAAARTKWEGGEPISPHSLAKYRRSSGANEVRPLDWKFRAAGESVAGLQLPDDPLQMVRIRIEKSGENCYDIQLNAPGWQLQSGVDYVLSFRARADEDRSIYAGISQAVEPWNNLGVYHEMELSPDWKSVEVRFQCTASSNEARIHFDVGHHTAAVELSTVALLAAAPAPHR